MSHEEAQETQENLDEVALNEEASRELAALVAEEESAAAMDAETPDDGPLASPQSETERAAVIEALIFVSEEPLTVRTLAEVLKLEKAAVEESLVKLAEAFNERQR